MDILIIYILYLIVLTVILCMAYLHIMYRKRVFSLDYKELQSGDILLFQGNTFSYKYTRYITAQEYTHAAMVITVNSRLYVLELDVDTTLTSVGDLKVIDLNLYAKNSKFKYCIGFYRGPDVSEYAYEYFKTHRHIAVERRFWTYFAPMMRVPDRKWCYEIVLEILQDAGLFDGNTADISVVENLHLYTGVHVAHYLE